MSERVNSANFVRQFFAHTRHAVEIRAMPSKARRFTRKPSEVEQFIKQHAHENVYFGVATREGGGDKSHCRELIALWADIDFKVSSEQQARASLESFTIQPSIVIESGGGLHVYWLLDAVIDAHDSGVESILRGLATTLRADLAAAEIARVMRLPGTFNRKPEYGKPRECLVIKADWDRRYSLSDFAPFATSYKRNPVTSHDYDAGVTEGSRNAYLTSVAGTIRRRGCSVPAIEAALLAENQHRCKPPLPESEVRNIASNVGRYETGFTNGPYSFHSAQLEKEFGQKPSSGKKGARLPFKTAAQIEHETPSEVNWLAKPYVAMGAITQVDGKVKLAGKTTWVTHLCGAVLDGAPFMGQPTIRTPVVYLTEQPPSSWRPVLDRAGILGRQDFVCLYFKDIRGIGWQTVTDAAIAECKRIGARLLIVDTLSQFAGISGDNENDAGEALQAMAPLQIAVGEGIAVIVIRHERKSGGTVGDSGRGSSAFAGAVDVVLSIRRPEGNTRKTLRVIHAIGRFEDTPEEMVVELTSRGFVALGTETDVAAGEAERAILETMSVSPEDALHLDDILKSTGTARATVQRAIAKLRAEGRLMTVGKGKRGDPWKYYRSNRGEESVEEGFQNSSCPNSTPILGRNNSETKADATEVAEHRENSPITTLPNKDRRESPLSDKPMVEVEI